MKTIAYYISDYGYGNASRSIAVIRKLLNYSEVEIKICHSFALSFIKESLHADRVSYRKIKTDIGYFLKRDSIFPDKEKLLEEYKKFVADWDFILEQEKVFLLTEKIDLVVYDISPVPFETADQLGIPSVKIWGQTPTQLCNDQPITFPGKIDENNIGNIKHKSC